MKRFIFVILNFILLSSLYAQEKFETKFNNGENLAFTITSEKIEISNDGKNIDKVVLVMFLSTRCPNCKNDIPNLNKLAQNSKNGEILAIFNEDISDQTLLKFQNTFKTTFSLSNTGEKIAKKLSIIGTPTYFLLDKNGQILHKYLGTINAEFYSQIEKIFN